MITFKNSIVTYLRITMALATVTFAFMASPLLAQTAPTIKGNPPDTNKLMLEDARLDRVDDFNVKCLRYDSLFDAVMKSSGLRFQAEASISHRRISYFGRKVSYRTFMAQIALISGFEWRAAPPENDIKKTEISYELFQTEAQKKRESSLIRASKMREETEREQKLSQIRDVIKNSPKGALSDFINGFSDEDLNSLAEASLAPEGLISANNQSHLHDRFLFPQPYSGLSQSVRDSVDPILNKNYANLDGVGFAPPVSNPASINSSQIGIIAMNGSIRLGVFSAQDDDVWVSPKDGIAIPAGSSQEIDDLDPKIREMYDSPFLSDLRSMPAEMKQKRIRFPASHDRRYLANFLDSIHQQTNLRIVCDDYLRTRSTTYYGLFSEKPDYPLDEVLLQLARTFSHSIRYSQGSLFLNTLTLGLDLRADPPGELEDMFTKATAEKRKLKLSEITALGRLSRLQFTTLQTTQPDWSFKHFGIIQKVQQQYSALHFFSILSPSEISESESSKGLLLKKLSGEKLKEYARASSIGFRRPNPSQKTTYEPGRFYTVVRGSEDAPSDITLYFTRDKSDAIVHLIPFQ